MHRKREFTNNDEQQQNKCEITTFTKKKRPRHSANEILGQREMPGGWFGFVATEEQERNWAAKAAAAKLVRAADGNARDAEKRRKIDSGVYANPATRCGGNMLVYSSRKRLRPFLPVGWQASGYWVVPPGRSLP